MSNNNSRREAFVPTFYKREEEADTKLQLLNEQHHKLLDLVEKVAEYPARVSYPHMLLPHSKVSFQYVKVIHTNEFKLLPEELKSFNTDKKKQALEKVDFVSYIEAGNQLKARMNKVQTRILNFQTGDKSSKVIDDDNSSSASPDKPSSSAAISSTGLDKSSNSKQFVNDDVASGYEELTKSATLPSPATKQSVPKPQVFEIREYITDTGSTSNEVVDITKQLELVEKMTAEQSDGASTTISSEEDDFVRELAMIRGRLEQDQKDSGEMTKSFDDDGIDDMFAKLEAKESRRNELSHPNKAPTQATQSAQSSKKANGNGWKAGFLSSGSSKKPAQKQQGEIKNELDSKIASGEGSNSKSITKGVHFSTANEVRTIDTQSTVSVPVNATNPQGPQNTHHLTTSKPVGSNIVEKQPFPPKHFGNTIVEKPASGPKPFSNTIVEKQPQGPKPFGNTIIEKQPQGIKPFGNSVVERQPSNAKPVGQSVVEKDPAGPKPIIAGNTRRS